MESVSGLRTDNVIVAVPYVLGKLLIAIMFHDIGKDSNIIVAMLEILPREIIMIQEESRRRKDLASEFPGKFTGLLRSTGLVI